MIVRDSQPQIVTDRRYRSINPIPQYFQAKGARGKGLPPRLCVAYTFQLEYIAESPTTSRGHLNSPYRHLQGRHSAELRLLCCYSRRVRFAKGGRMLPHRAAIDSLPHCVYLIVSSTCGVCAVLVSSDTSLAVCVTMASSNPARAR